jgi:signal transduction histidine kinase
MRLSRVRLWHAYVAVGIATSAVYFLFPPGIVQNGIYDGVSLSAVAAILVGLRIHRVRDRKPWLLLAAGQMLFSIGNFIYDYYEFVLNYDSPFPSLADAAFLAGYPVLAVGLALLIRSRARGHDKNGLIDATIVATGIGLLAWIYLMLPYADDPALTALEKVVSIAYPLMDILLLALVLRLVIGGHRRLTTVVLLVVSFVFTLVADASFAWVELAGGYADGMWMDAAWMLGFTFFGAAALHPSARDVSLPASASAAKRSRYRLTLLAAASLMAPGAMSIQVLRGQHDDEIVIAAVAAVLFLLVVLRMAGLVRDVQLKADLLAVKGRELELAHADRSRILARMVEAGEQERKLLAADLHDGPIQRLSAIDITLHNLSGHIPPADAGGHVKVEQLHDRTRTTINELRTMMHDLHPPALKERGLPAALSDYIGEVNHATGLRGTVDCRVDGRLAPELEATLFRVVQEAVANVVKHAEGRVFSVTLGAANGSVELEVVDDGKGFVPGHVLNGSKDMHYGLIAMRERVEILGGTWELTSVPTAGTRIRALIPRRDTDE